MDDGGSTHAQVLWTPPEERDRFLPEGPRLVRVNDRDALAWVNIQTAVDAVAGDIHLLFLADGEYRRLPQAQRPGFLVPSDRRGAVWVGREKTIGLLNLSDNSWTPTAQIPDPHPRTIINHGEISPDGRWIVFGTKDLQFREPIAHLYLFDTGDGSLTVLADGQTCSNGKIITGTGDRLDLWDIDTPRKRVDRYLLNTATRRLESSQTILDLSHRPDFPDGMIGLGDDTAVIGFYHPGNVTDGSAVRFDLRTGEPINRWTFPGSPRVTCPCVLSDTELVFTTAVEGMPNDLRIRCPNAGCLFVAPRHS